MKSFVLGGDHTVLNRRGNATREGSLRRQAQRTPKGKTGSPRRPLSRHRYGPFVGLHRRVRRRLLSHSENRNGFRLGHQR